MTAICNTRKHGADKHRQWLGIEPGNLLAVQAANASCFLAPESDGSAGVWRVMADSGAEGEDWTVCVLAAGCPALGAAAAAGTGVGFALSGLLKCGGARGAAAAAAAVE